MKKIFHNLKLLAYNRLYVPVRVRMVRKKKTISVAFLIWELASWKTELLYLSMLAHPRFYPRLIVVKCPNSYDSYKMVISYLESKGYDYLFVNETQKIRDYFKPDIIFYQKPYQSEVFDRQKLRYNFSSLFCYVPYSCLNYIAEWSICQPISLYAWQHYLLNDFTKEEMSRALPSKKNSLVVTGLPFNDKYISYSCNNDPWKSRDPKIKRIIWAPHHTIPHTESSRSNYINFSTFLTYSDFMLEVADSYNGSVEFAFKPHPLLRYRLEKKWGKEKTDTYYAKWSDGDNTQLIEGDYVDLIMHSDAMIHDCASFILEYYFSGKPSLFLLNGQDTTGMVQFEKEGFDLLYKAETREQIIRFVDDIIAGKDPKLTAREEFKNRYLIPKGDSASENIINAILGDN